MTPPTDDPSTDTPPAPEAARARRRRFLFWGGAGIFALTTLASMRALAHGFGGHRRFGRHGLGAASEDELRAHMKERAGRALDWLDATDAQERQVFAIVDDVAPELFRVRSEADALREDARSAFERNDGYAIEAARKRGVALIDRASKVGVDAMQRALAVLDAAQRDKLARLHRRWH
jgi:Spy/CpxP family protein refolding chaperone